MSPRQPLSLGEQGLYALCVLCVYVQARLWVRHQSRQWGMQRGREGI